MIFGAFTEIGTYLYNYKTLTPLCYEVISALAVQCSTTPAYCLAFAFHHFINYILGIKYSIFPATEYADHHHDHITDGGFVDSEKENSLYNIHRKAHSEHSQRMCSLLAR